jgi:PAS domain S-box-containing protein
MTSAQACLAVIDMGAQASVVMNDHGQIVHWGDDAAAILGWTAEEVVGRSVADTIVPRFYREAHRRGVAACRSGRRPMAMGRLVDMPALRRDGSEIPVEILVLVGTTPEGRLQFGASLRDLSGEAAVRQLRDMELEVSRSLLHSPVTAGIASALALVAEGLGCEAAQLWLPDAGGVLSPRCSWDRGSPQVAGFLRDRAHDLLSSRETLAAVWRSGLPFVADTGMEHTDELLRGAAQAGLSCLTAYPLPATGRHPGALVLLAARRQPVDQELLAVMGSITAMMGQALARDQAEMALRRDRFRALLEAAPDAILGVGASGRVALMNLAAEQLFGYPRAEVLGRSVEVLVPDVTPSTHPALFDGRLAAFPTGAMRESREVTARHRDGRRIPVEISAGVIELEDETLVMTAIRDVTERRQAQEAVQRARAAELANQAKTRFLSRVSHELRTPLNAILGFAQLLSTADLPDREREQVQIIHRAGSHLTALIEEVLDLSRIEEGALPLSIVPVPVESAVREAAELVAPMATERRISMVADPVIPPRSCVLADRQRLRQVLVNLLSNAVKFNRPGGSVHVVLERGAGRTRLGVVDTGWGISAENLHRLFQPFDRLGAECSGVEGTGLGLALSKHLVSAMGGSLTVDSRPGEGSTFWVDLGERQAPRRLRSRPRPTAGSGETATLTRAVDAGASHTLG